MLKNPIPVFRDSEAEIAALERRIEELEKKLEKEKEKQERMQETVSFKLCVMMYVLVLNAPVIDIFMTSYVIVT